MRIEGVPDGRGGIFVRLAYWLTRRRLGRVVEPVRAMAHNPPVLKSAAKAMLELEKARTLPPRLKHLVSIRAAQMVECAF